MAEYGYDWGKEKTLHICHKAVSPKAGVPSFQVQTVLSTNKMYSKQVYTCTRRKVQSLTEAHIHACGNAVLEIS